jgi:hypothetical protein
MPTTVEFVDIAGLVRGASKGGSVLTYTHQLAALLCSAAAAAAAGADHC